LPKSSIRMTDFEKKMCEVIKHKEMELAAQELGLTVKAIYQRFYRLRNRIEEAQGLVNDVNNFKKQSARLRKLLTKGDVEE
jgi:hypothetical protein